MTPSTGGSPSSPTGTSWSTREAPSTRPCVRVARDRKSTRLNSSHGHISYAGFCLEKIHKPISVGKKRPATIKAHKNLYKNYFPATIATLPNGNNHGARATRRLHALPSDASRTLHH